MYGVPVAEPACGLPVTSVVPFMTCIMKSAGVAVAPGLAVLSTILMTVSVPVVGGAAAVFVMVQVRLSPAASVTAPVLSQSPEKVAV